MSTATDPGRWWLITYTCIVLGSVVSCATFPRLPSEGGRPWLRLESEHFVLHSDQPAASARELSDQLEQQFAALCGLGFECTGKLFTKLRVIMLDDQALFEHFVPPPWLGLYARNALFEPLLILPRRATADRLRMVNHHLAYVIADLAMGPWPLWLREGLASYFSTAYYDGSGAFVVGYAPMRFTAARFPHVGLLDRDGPALPAALRAHAFLVVHLLMSERSAQFAQFQADIARGEPPGQSWARAFPDLAVNGLEQQLRHYARSTVRRSFTAELTRARTGVELRALSDADVHTLRAELYATLEPDPETSAQLLHNLHLALQKDPGHVRAAALLVQHQRDGSELARAQALIRTHPDEWLGYQLLATLRTEPGSAAMSCDPELVERLKALGPRQPYGLMRAALCEASAGNEAHARALAATAQALLPNQPELALQHGRVLQGVGACAELAELRQKLEASQLESLRAPLSRLGPCSSAGQPRP